MNILRPTCTYSTYNTILYSLYYRPISAPLPPPPPIKLEDVYEYQEVLKVARPPPPHTTTEYVDHATGRNTHHGGMMRQQNKKTSSQRKTSRVRVSEGYNILLLNF